MQLFQKSLFSFFLFKCVSVPMIILNEHMHSNMIDVYQKNRNGIQEMSRSSGHYPIRRKFPRETHFSEKSSKRFSLQKKSYPPAGLFQITIFRRCDPRTQTWSDSASEEYASSSFPFERASELPVTFDSPGSSQRSFNRIPGFSKNFPSRGYSNKTKDHQRSQYIHVQMASGNLFFQLEA